MCQELNITSTVVMGIHPHFAFYIATLAFQNEKLLLEDWLNIKARQIPIERFVVNLLNFLEEQLCLNNAVGAA